MILSRLSTAVNKAIHLDPQAIGKLKPLSNQVVALNFNGIDLTLYTKFTEDGVEFYDAWNEAVTTTISGTPISLLGMHSEMYKRQLFQGNVSIQGNMHFAQDVQKFLNNIDIDWEEQLSKVVGDVAAHQINNIARAGKSFLKQAAETFQQNVGEYLQEEKKLSPSPEEIQDFCDDVDKLRNDVERLIKRGQTP